DSEDALCALEASIASTRAQLEAFRVRLEAVEADTARHEAEIEASQAPPSISREAQHEEETNQPNTGVSAENAHPSEDVKGRGPEIEDVPGFTFSLRDITRSVSNHSNLAWYELDHGLIADHPHVDLRSLHYASHASCGSRSQFVPLSCAEFGLGDGSVDVEP
ncbi:hypothetical protein HYDPIDRAFT_30097, partial [Hydnomerulius pinastri MD-312]